MAYKNLKKDIQNYQALKKDKKPILYVRNLYKKYPHKKKAAIDKISFDVFKGQIHAFIGANGAGKTTTIKSIIGAYAKWSGTVLISGIKNTTALAKENLGYIPEYTQFPKRLSCYKYLYWMAQMSGLNKIKAKQKVIELLKKYKLINLAKKSINSLSSGQKKLILVIQATIHDPNIIIMDEPTANLDPKARSVFFSLLLKLKKQDKAIFISSHNLSELNQYADSVTILDGGKIVFTGLIKELAEKYQKNTYIIDSSNNGLLIRTFKKHKIQYKHIKHSKGYAAKFINYRQYKSFFKDLKTKNIFITHLTKKPISLDDIYEKLIKHGSIDTIQNKNDEKNK